MVINLYLHKRFMEMVKKTIATISKTPSMALLPYLIIIFAFCFGEIAILIFFPNHKILAWFCLYTVISNFFVTIFPHEPIIMAMGKMYAPLLVALLGAIATCFIEVFNYQILRHITGNKHVQKFTSKKLYQSSERLFNKTPFFALFFGSLTPVPFGIFRFFAANSEYSSFLLLIAVFLGRLPRYYILAWAGPLVPKWIYVAFFIILIGYAILRKCLLSIAKNIDKV